MRAVLELRCGCRLRPPFQRCRMAAALETIGREATRRLFRDGTDWEARRQRTWAAEELHDHFARNTPEVPEPGARAPLAGVGG